MDFSTIENALRSLSRRETVEVQFRVLSNDLLAKAALQASLTVVEAAVRCFSVSAEWECIAVGLLLTKEITDRADVLSPNFAEYLFDQADALLEHREPRVRNLMTSVLASLASRSEFGLIVYSRLSTRLSEIIETHFDLATSARVYQISDTKYIPADDCTGWKVLAMLCNAQYAYDMLILRRSRKSRIHKVHFHYSGRSAFRYWPRTHVQCCCLRYSAINVTASVTLSWHTSRHRCRQSPCTWLRSF